MRKRDFNGLEQAEASLPGHYYFDAQHHEREMAALWYRQWLYVCRADAIGEPGQFQTYRIGTQSILIVRDQDGSLRAFHNTCRHRGSILCDAVSGRFKSKLITCPYHQWAYAFDGRLVSTTSHEEPAGFDKADYPLFSAGVMEWRGSVFVCPAGTDQAPHFEDAFLRDADRLNNWPLEDLKTGHVWTKRMACNWKAFWENFNECLHCPNIHPELCELVPIYGRRISQVKDAANWVEFADVDDPKYQGGLRDGAETWSGSGQAVGAVFPELTEAERSAGQTYIVSLPSTFVAAHVDYVRIVSLRPLGPEETELKSEWLFPEATLKDPDFNMADVTDFATLVMEQDATACEMNQRGIHAAPFEAGVLMPEEYYLYQFHEWVRGGLAKV